MNTPTDQLEALRQNILTEFKQVLKLAPDDYTENCTNVVMSMVEALIHTREQEARASELEMMRPPKVGMIPEWKWPCYICGFDRDKLTEYIEARLATLNKEQQ